MLPEPRPLIPTGSTIVGCGGAIHPCSATLARLSSFAERAALLHRLMEAPRRVAGALPAAPRNTCYIDDIQSWSTNEEALNWHSALACNAAFLADQHGNTTPSGSAGPRVPAESHRKELA